MSNNKEIAVPNSATPQVVEVKKVESKRAPSNSIENPKTIIRQGMFILFFFFGVLGIWAFFSEISGAVVGQGKIKVESERKSIQHLEGGIVEDILVRQGDAVTAGQILIVLESSQVNASVDLYTKQLAAILAAQTRLKAEKEWKKDLEWPQELLDLAKQPEIQEILDSETKIFTTRYQAVEGQVSLMESQINQIGSQIKGSEEQNRSEHKIIQTLEEELQAKRQLFNERYVEKSQILELERVLATHQGNRGRIQQSIAESRQRIGELQLRIADLKNRFVEDATAQLGRQENELLQTRDRMRPLTDAKRRLNVISPVSGKVVNLAVHSKGGVVRAGEVLMDIVPEDTPLIVEVQVPVNKISEVFVGQAAQVQLDAFDTAKVPHIAAEVIYISADRHEDRTNTGVMPYYIAHVQIDPTSLSEAKAYISPGMPATVFITTESRTVWNYMLEPLVKNWDRALRD